MPHLYNIQQNDGETLDDAINRYFGVTPGSHVPHILDQRTGDRGTALFPDGEDHVKVETSGYGDVSQQEAYQTKSEINTLKNFRNLVKSSILTEDTFPNDPDYTKVLYAVKNYVTAGRRSSQQSYLQVLKTQIKQSKASFKKREDAGEDVSAQKLFLDQFEETLAPSMGNLAVDQKHIDNRPEVTEPSDTGWGVFGKWSDASNQELFPHDPSPNDVKQGIGLQTCYMLSVLTQQAAIDPDFIKNCMRDNGDGTVTVKFHHCQYNGENDTYEPQGDVLIDVKKTVKKSASSNVYSSSSLWVQIMEKAYAKYVDEYQQSFYGATSKVGKRGMAKINLGGSNNFMVALTGKSHKQTDQINPLSLTGKYYKNRAGQPVKARPEGYYAPIENEIYDVLDKYVNGKDGVEPQLVTTGINVDPERHTSKECHNLGLRDGHAYTIRKVFEKEVNGQMRKFVQLRDPYAVFEAAHDPNTHELKAKDGNMGLISNNYTAGGDNMGTFNMELSEYFDYFTTVHCPDAMSKELNNVKSKAYAAEKAQEAEKKNGINQEKEKAAGADQKSDMIDDFNIIDGFDAEQKDKPVENAAPQKPEEEKKDDQKDDQVLDLDEDEQKVNKITDEEVKSFEDALNIEEEVINEQPKVEDDKKVNEQPKVEDGKKVSEQPKAEAEKEVNEQPKVEDEKDLSKSENNENIIDTSAKKNIDDDFQMVDVEDVQNDQKAVDVAAQNELSAENQKLANIYDKQILFANFRQNIRNIMSDISSTDYTLIRWKDTKEFADMRKTLYALDDFMENVKEQGSKYTNLYAEEYGPRDEKGNLPNYVSPSDVFVGMVNSLREKASAYVDSKNKSVEAEFKAKEQPSERAMIRLTAAALLDSICGGEIPPDQFPGRRIDKLKVLVGDTVTSMKDKKFQDMLAKNEKKSKNFQKAVDNLNKYLMENDDERRKAGLTEEDAKLFEKYTNKLGLANKVQADKAVGNKGYEVEKSIMSHPNNLVGF